MTHMEVVVTNLPGHHCSYDHLPLVTKLLNFECNEDVTFDAQELTAVDVKVLNTEVEFHRSKLKNEK